MQNMKKIILISLDTLRVDHLGCYGYYRNTSPTIDELAEESLLFNYALATVSYTSPSFASLFTSKYASFHSCQFHNGDGSCPDYKELMLQEVLKREGCKTSAFISNLVLSSRWNKLHKKGFDVYDDEIDISEANRPEVLFRRGEHTVQRALAWLKENYKDEFFLWIHFMDIHGPYMPPKSYRGLFVNDEYWNKPPILLNKASLISEPMFGHVSDHYVPAIFGYQVLRREDSMGAYEKNVDYYISQYDAAIRYVDDQVKMLINYIKALGIYDDTLIIIHSDHGEAFGENGIYFLHGLTTTLDQIRVPLIIKLPGKKKRIIEDKPVSLIDVAPSILNFYDIDSEEEFQGRSFFSKDKGNKRVIYSQIIKQLSVISSGIQLLYGKGIFERTEKNIFGWNIHQEYENIIANKKVISLEDGEEILTEFLNADQKEQIETLNKHALEFLLSTRMQVQDKREIGSEDSNQDEILKKHLAALGYVDG